MELLRVVPDNCAKRRGCTKVCGPSALLAPGGTRDRGAWGTGAWVGDLDWRAVAVINKSGEGRFKSREAAVNVTGVATRADKMTKIMLEVAGAGARHYVERLHVRLAAGRGTALPGSKAVEELSRRPTNHNTSYRDIAERQIPPPTDPCSKMVLALPRARRAPVSFLPMPGSSANPAIDSAPFSFP